MHFDRLTPGQLRLIKHLARYCGVGGQVTLNYRLCLSVPPLWRRGLVAVWYRQVPEAGIRGPFYGLTLDGQRLASAIFHPLNRTVAA